MDFPEFPSSLYVEFSATGQLVAHRTLDAISAADGVNVAVYEFTEIGVLKTSRWICVDGVAHKGKGK